MDKTVHLKDRVQRLWLGWTGLSDTEGLTDFYGQQRRAARELFIAGEYITFSAPSDVGGNYESFQYRTPLQVATALGLGRSHVRHERRDQRH